MDDPLYKETDVFQIYTSVSAALKKLEEQEGYKLTGGSGKGNSYYQTFSRCPRAFFYRYENKDSDMFFVESGAFTPRDLGSVWHAYAATYYRRVLGLTKMTPEQLKDYLLKEDCNPQSVLEAWRLWECYAAYYLHDYLVPRAVEYTAIEPWWKHSCRYDLIAEVNLKKAPRGLYREGVYNVEHKTQSDSFVASSDAWELDGEILGQVAIWGKSNAIKEFGPLTGVIINTVTKGKAPKMSRRTVDPSMFKSKVHLTVLRHLDARIHEMRKYKYWPQYWSGCTTRFGRCDFFDTCRMEEAE